MKYRIGDPILYREEISLITNIDADRYYCTRLGSTINCFWEGSTLCQVSTLAYGVRVEILKAQSGSNGCEHFTGVITDKHHTNGKPWSGKHADGIKIKLDYDGTVWNLGTEGFELKVLDGSDTKKDTASSEEHYEIY